jgi:YegS/Rv2252/BmrU family lipid kinase
VVRKATLISNPKTGRYASRRLPPIQELASQLESLGVTVDLRFTAAPGDATEIAARAARNGSSDVIVAGGDGTINEAIQGLAGTKARLGIIPRGTANVLARELGLPLDDAQAVAVAGKGKSRKIYLGLAIDETTNATRHFVLMAGIGLDASVVRRVQPSLKKRIGQGAFWISGLSHLATWNPRPFTLEIDGVKYVATFAAVPVMVAIWQSRPAQVWTSASLRFVLFKPRAGFGTCICFRMQCAMACRATIPRCGLLRQ